jgi:hypothetical protein
MSLLKRIALAFSLGLFIGINISLSYGATLPAAIGDGLIFSVFICILVALVSWGMDIAENKGYPFGVGFWLALLLNIIGIAILLLLPVRRDGELGQ